MEMEQLNKSQLVLLTLLVSFVTSIATGIVTVSLMQQAPPAITQTVSKVIERTVEKVVPGQSASVASVVSAPATTKTVVVTQSDTIAQAVAKISDSVVRLSTSDASASKFLGLGVVVNRAGVIAADAASLGELADAIVTLPAGASQRMFVFARDGNGIAYLAPATTTESTIVWTPVVMAAERATLGSTVVVLGGKMSTRVAQGIVTGFAPLSEVAGTSSVQVIETDVSESSILAGAPLVDASGNLLGITVGTARAVSHQGFISAYAISAPEH